eukprot:6181238-Pleurochrysis_carterae.AAC.2
MIEEARVAPPAFASLRNLAAEAPGALVREPRPGDLWAPQPTEPTGKRRRARARKPLPSNGRGAAPADE